MTTTSTMCGLGTEEKPTSRVLRPPGGNSSDIFGTSSQNPAPQRQQQHNRGASNIFGASDETASPKGQSCGQLAGAEEHKIYGKGRNQSKFNPITGESYDDDASPSAATPPPQPPRQTQQTASPIVGASAQVGQGDSTPQPPQGDLQAAPGKAQPTVHTSSRVLNPPGGHTHKLW